ncbi:MAG: preprotein translocase subunit SecG [Planctomycetes bacterium]|nr:preprotein translocase subunit SecG [Planctomycetota bacterium]MCW8136073.1 preprotein translocase subunit SecG [Planctomycetota bacterium]
MLANAAVNTLLAVLFIVNCVVMIVFVLFRQSDSGGIGAAFGGGDGGGAFGTKGQAVVDKVLTFMGATFIVLALIFNLVSTSGGKTDTTGVEGTSTPKEGE